MFMAYSASAVAGWILWLASRKRITLSPMQLQKHLYYAQGYSLGMTGEKLFDERIFAWQHGPVVPEVFHQYKRFAASAVTPPGHAEIPESVFGVIDAVIDAKGRMSASKLRNATHEEPPYMDTPPGDEITPEKMLGFFTGLFWASDEEDEYEPSFDSEEEELAFFRETPSR
jgi:uncharacterized phage-associated protein